MINKNNKVFTEYLGSLVNRVFKILPLYEEKNVGLQNNIDSLIFELEGLIGIVEDLDVSSEYVSLLSVLKSLSNESSNPSNDKSIVKREVFKCIDLIKKMKSSIESD